MPAFRLPTLWAALGKHRTVQVPVYAGKSHVLLVKVMLLLANKL